MQTLQAISTKLIENFPKSTCTTGSLNMLLQSNFGNTSNSSFLALRNKLRAQSRKKRVYPTHLSSLAAKRHFGMSKGIMLLSFGDLYYYTRKIGKGKFYIDLVE